MLENIAICKLDQIFLCLNCYFWSTLDLLLDYLQKHLKVPLFFTLKNKINREGKIAVCQKIVNEMLRNFEPTRMWQPGNGDVYLRSLFMFVLSAVYINDATENLEDNRMARFWRW